MRKIKLRVEALVQRVYDVDIEIELEAGGPPLEDRIKDEARAQIREELPEDEGWPVDDSQWDIRGYGPDGELLDADTNFVVVNDVLVRGRRMFFMHEKGFVSDEEGTERSQLSYCEAVEICRSDLGDKILYWPGNVDENEDSVHE